MSPRIRLPLALLLAASSAAAQAPSGPALGGLDLVTLRARQGVWNQMFGSVENPTDRDIPAAEVVYPSEDPRLGKVLFGRRVWLPAHSRSTVWLTVRPGLLEGPKMGGRSQISAAVQSAELIDASTGRLLDRKGELRFLQIRPDTRLIAYVDDAAGDGDALPDAAYSYLQQAQTYLYTATTVGLRNLPDQWPGYSGVDLLLVGRLDPISKARRPSQVQAMLDWVSQGGVLVLFATEGMERTLAGPLGQAARVACAGTDRVRGLAVRSADGRFSLDVTLGEAVLLADLVADGADVLVRANQAPLLTRARYGQGHVFVLATAVGTLGRRFANPELPEAPEEPRLLRVWQAVGEALVFEPAVRNELFLDPLRVEHTGDGGERPHLIQEKLRAITGRRGTGRTAVLAWLGGFAVLTGLVGLVMRFFRAGERTWLVMLPAAALLTAGLYAYAETRKAHASLSYVGLALTGPEGRTAVYQAVGLYSPERRAASVGSGSELGWLMPLGRREAPGLEQTALRSANGMIWPGMVVERDSARAFLAAAVIDPVRLDASLRPGPGGLTGSIFNRTGQPLGDAVLYLRGRAFAVGDLPAGAVMSVTIGPDRRLGAGQFVPRVFMKPEDRWHNELIAALTAPPSSGSVAGLEDNEPYLLAWAAGPLLSPGEGLAEVPGRGMMLLGRRLHLRPATAGQQVLLSDEMLIKQYNSVGTPLWSRQTGFARCNGPGAVDVHVAPPPQAGRLAEARMTVEILIDAAGWRLAVQGIRPDGATQTLATFEHPSGPKTVTIDPADPFMADGVVRIRAQVEGLDAGTAGRQLQWGFEDFTVTLQGTVQ